MDSIVLYTEEIDDLREGVSELLAQSWMFPLKKHSLALIFTEEEVDFRELCEHLTEHWDFPIVGCTAMGMLGKQGYLGLGISILLLTADDCFFAADMTGELDRESYRPEITRIYKELRETLPSDPKLILSYGAMFLSENDVAGDDVVEAITEAAGKNVPLFGGLAGERKSGAACRSAKCSRGRCPRTTLPSCRKSARKRWPARLSPRT